GRLESVLRVVGVGEHAAADAHDQAPVALDQGREGGLVVRAGEAADQVAVVQVRRLPGAEVAQDGFHVALDHDSDAPALGTPTQYRHAAAGRLPKFEKNVAAEVAWFAGRRPPG